MDRTVLHGGLELLLIDCQLLTEIDCSGVDALKRVKSMAQNRHVKLVLAALQPRLIQKLRRVGVINVPRTDDLITCPTLNDALEYGEDLLVELSQGDARETEHDFVSKKTQECGEDSFEALREQMSQDRIALVEVPMPHPDVGKQSISFVQGKNEFLPVVCLRGLQMNGAAQVFLLSPLCNWKKFFNSKTTLNEAKSKQVEYCGSAAKYHFKPCT